MVTDTLEQVWTYVYSGTHLLYEVKEPGGHVVERTFYIVGAPYFDNGQTDEGGAFVYYGSASGLEASSAWTVESDQAGAHLGFSASTAGDVNGDGYADVIVGASGYSSGQSNEGQAYVYHGSANGIETSPAWTSEGDQDYAGFGRSVSTAGEVNGDGYADVIVGANGYSNGQTSEGRAFVYHGSANGLQTSPAWTAESNQEGAFFGYSVSTAGDVNGDGCADVIVGAFPYDNSQIDEGRAYVYHGSAGGLEASPAWTAESNQASAEFGQSVSAAGDVNGDGYADVIVGAPYYDNGQTDEGRAYVYYGNEGDGLHLLPRQMRADGSAPIAPLGRVPFGCGSLTEVQLRLLGRMPLGREKVKLQWQVAPLGTPFTSTVGVVDGISPAWLDTGAGGVTITQTVTGLAVGTPYHWRVRLLYRPGNALGQAASRWIHVPWNGWNEQDFRTPPELLRAGFVATPTVGTAPLQVEFSDESTPAGAADEWRWAFGDGGTSMAQQPVYTYTLPGVYTVTQWITDTASGATDVLTRSGYVTVAGQGAVVVTTTISYDYDPLYRLASATYSTGEVYTYTYDSVGNRLKKGVSGAVTEYVYDDANRLTSAGGVEYTWDQNGNLLDDGLRSYTYDHANRLVQVVSGTFTTTFAYNGDGHRIAKAENGVTTTYVVAVLGLSQVLVETTGGQTTRYVYGHDLLAEHDGEAWAWHLNDGLGSVRQLAGASGNVTLAQGYTPFGVPLPSQGSGATGYGFTGERWEAYSALLFLRARYYQPETGLFVSKDPWPGDVERPLTFHRWIYVQGNPVNAIDPSGWYHRYVHYTLVRNWTIEMASLYGFSEPVRLANRVAEADWYVDDSMALNSVACGDCHFFPLGATMRHIRQAIDSCCPYRFGAALHQLQDWWSHWNEGYTRQHLLDSRRAGVKPGQTSHRNDELITSFYRTHFWYAVERDIQRRNLELNRRGLSDDALIDLYLRKDAHLNPNWQSRVEERGEYGIDPDRYVKGSWRDEEMRIITRTWIAQFVRNSVTNCCEMDWDKPDDSDLRRFLQE